MALDLSKPLSWKKASPRQLQALQSLQGNILKGHGRPETVNIFFRLDPTQAQASRRALREIANFHLTNAHQQLLEAEVFKGDKTKPGKTFVSAYLSFTGYAALGRAGAAPQDEPAFTKGMKHADNLAAVGDKPISNWEAPFQQQIDGMLLVGDMTRDLVMAKRDATVKLLYACGATIIHEQQGTAVLNKAGIGIEHFGYVDGRSQPLLLQEDIDAESPNGGLTGWDPIFGLGAALVEEKPLTEGAHFGSYFIFRKLEQDVRGFKRMEQQLATDLEYTNAESRELAGAFVVGRFEDGTPVTLSDEARSDEPPNNFNYSGDGGARCPFQAHIRKVNPRSTTLGAARVGERSRIMPRRGIPFEDAPRVMHPSDVPGSDNLAGFDNDIAKLLPTGQVGLLFMAYNQSLARQFVFTQASWANATGFPVPNTGVDPVIGELPAGVTQPQTWNKTWDKKPVNPAQDQVNFDFHGFVTLRGGEYFFAPSLSFLKSL